MLSIQIDTKSLELLIYHQFNIIKLSFFSSFPVLDVIDAVRLLDTLDDLATSFLLSGREDIFAHTL